MHHTMYQNLSYELVLEGWFHFATAFQTDHFVKVKFGRFLKIWVTPSPYVTFLIERLLFIGGGGTMISNNSYILLLKESSNMTSEITL